MVGRPAAVPSAAAAGGKVYTVVAGVNTVAAIRG